MRKEVLLVHISPSGCCNTLVTMLNNGDFGFPYCATPAFSTHAVWCRVFQSRVFQSRVFSRPIYPGWTSSTGFPINHRPKTHSFALWPCDRQTDGRIAASLSVCPDTGSIITASRSRRQNGTSLQSVNPSVRLSWAGEFFSAASLSPVDTNRYVMSSPAHALPPRRGRLYFQRAPAGPPTAPPMPIAAGRWIMDKKFTAREAGALAIDCHVTNSSSSPWCVD